ncbi:conserved hypothetical protein [Magnetospirillum sp. LM-5]|uniref:FIST signal transduction protein n=1 Tax=Magnetospirillum sp. LM-5 TaxID=2681466 RepID=UPI0013816613|nr:FIST N-terminal domain-containing protein [Magnetospirillum sp. LM-5]CAA7617791.1 conserved hypothetical protein [Magnetospirillum sp. LM-5]
MEIRQTVVTGGEPLAALSEISPNLVLVFGSVAAMRVPEFHAQLRAAFPAAELIGCSTAGEIAGQRVRDGSVVLTAIRWDKTRQRVAKARVTDMAHSDDAGRDIGRVLKGDGLRAVLVFGKGLGINGSALIEGIIAEVGGEVPISGGLAGDGGAFTETLTLSTDGIDCDGVVAVGLYGDAVEIGHGSYGGWQPFGPVRKVTRSEGNVLFELDGQSALALYKEYLGEYAKDLPASGLLFPFEMLREDHSTVGLIRTILGVDEASGSLVLAGDIDANGYLRLMHANNDGLVDGAETAAKRAGAGPGAIPGQTLGILVSCVGRKLVMGDAVEDEVEAVATVLGKSATIAGFYSYGEIAPFSSNIDCKLHNQTMTVTFIAER